METGNLELVELLIAAHADVNHRNVDGWSAFHFAARHSRYEIVKVLLAAGADVNLANKLGKTPILARFPARWNHLAEKESRQLNMLEHVLIAKPVSTLAGHALEAPNDAAMRQLLVAAGAK